MTTLTAYSLLASLYMLTSSPAARADCSAALNEEIAHVEHAVGALRPDKAGQMRVFASDGSEYTAGQTSWMKGQLRGITRSCLRGDESTAAAALHAVESVLDSHHKKT